MANTMQLLYACAVQSTAVTSQTVPMVRDRVVDSNLTIHNMSLNDAGAYHCTATTHDRKTGVHAVHVHVYSTPTVFPQTTRL